MIADTPKTIKYRLTRREMGKFEPPVSAVVKDGFDTPDDVKTHWEASDLGEVWRNGPLGVPVYYWQAYFA